MDRDCEGCRHHSMGDMGHVEVALASPLIALSTSVCFQNVFLTPSAPSGPRVSVNPAWIQEVLAPFPNVNTHAQIHTHS